MLTTGSCWFCGMEFLIFGNGGDDVMRDAMVNSSGDLLCSNCAAESEREEQEQDDGYDDGDPFF